MKTRIYKTLNGFLNQALKDQLTVEKMSLGYFYDGHGKVIRFHLPIEVREELYKAVSEEIYSSRKAQKECFNAFMDAVGDYSYFQCFYVERSKDGQVYVSNSLSGEAYDYCKRMFLKSTR